MENMSHARNKIMSKRVQCRSGECLTVFFFFFYGLLKLNAKIAQKSCTIKWVNVSQLFVPCGLGRGSLRTMKCFLETKKT